MRNFGTFDANLVLRDVADGAVNSTASETAIKFEARKIGAYKAKVYVTAVDVANADETYAFSVEISDLIGGTFTKIAELSFSAGTLAAGEYEIALTGQQAHQMDADADWVRITRTLGGTTPSVTYGAYLTKA